MQLLKAGKGKEVSYNALATHIIAEDGDNPEVGESREVFDLPVVKVNTRNIALVIHILSKGNNLDWSPDCNICDHVLLILEMCCNVEHSECFLFQPSWVILSVKCGDLLPYPSMINGFESPQLWCRFCTRHIMHQLNAILQLMKRWIACCLDVYLSWLVINQSYRIFPRVRSSVLWCYSLSATCKLCLHILTIDSNLHIVICHCQAVGLILGLTSLVIFTVVRGSQHTLGLCNILWRRLSAPLQQDVHTSGCAWTKGGKHMSVLMHIINVY